MSAMDAPQPAAPADRGSRWVVLALQGELDLAVATATQCLVELELSYGHDVELGLEALEFVDCTGLAALVGANRHAERLNRKLRISGPTQAQVRRILALTGTDAILPLVRV